jgi:hypothetical protein
VRGQWTLTFPADVGFICDNAFVTVAKHREPINDTASVTTFMMELSTVTSLIP